MQTFVNQVDDFFKNINKTTVVVVGDIMLDAYLNGKVDRISPEAPVPVLELKQRVYLPGGAANVALNIKSLGAEVCLFSIVGNDDNGKILKKILNNKNVSVSNIVTCDKSKTTTKFRIVSSKTQLLRVDEELIQDISLETENILLSNIEKCLKENGVKVVILQDYNKGVLSKSMIDRVIALCNKYKIAIAVDPKKKNFSNYKNITLFKPNLKEINEGLDITIDTSSIEMLGNSAMKLHESQKIEQVMITLSDKGLFLSCFKNDLQSCFIFPAVPRSISDVSGAGDTVISVAALGIAAKINPEINAIISNIAGGLVCEKPGVVAIDKDELHKELNNENLISKFIFKK